jgi:hypothetical protein
MFRQILVGYLDDEPGREALALGRVLAQATGAEFEAVTAGEGDGGPIRRLLHRSVTSRFMQEGPARS